MSQLNPEASTPAAKIVRWTVSIHALAVAAQLSMAVFIIAGRADVYAGHKDNAWIVLVLGIALALAVWGLAGRRMGWIYRSYALAIPAFEGLQIWLGQQAQTPWHVTLGVLIWAAALALLIRVWMPTWLDAPTPAT